MSVIFKTLKKLQQQTDLQGHGAKGAHLRKTDLLHRLLTPPFSMGLFFGVIILAGFLLLYGLGRISDAHRESQGSTPRFMVAKGAVDPVKSSDHSVLKKEIHSSSTPSVKAKVLPPLFEKQDVDGGTLPPLKSEPFYQRPSGDNPNGADLKDNLSRNDPLLLGQNKGFLKTASLKTEQTSDPKQQRHLANLEKFRQTAKKRADIAKLVAQIEAAILSMDAPAVKKLMPRLSAVKGQDNLYVLNLKAFWYLKQKRYVAAEILLKNILKQDQDHLEAGVNMAVVEAKTQRKEAALKRLRRLKALYPENQVLIEMIRKLS